MTEDSVNPYAAPSHDQLELATEASDRFYIVSGVKFLLLYLLTMGLYGLYWDYKQWALIKRATRGDEWPVMRAIFSVFFQHSLNAEIDQSLRRQQIAFDWNHNARATAVVIVMLVASISGRMSNREFGGLAVDLISVACVPLLAVLRLQVQRAANAACGDPDGRGNSQFTAANIIWFVIGSLFWLLVLVGIFMPAEA